MSIQYVDNVYFTLTVKSILPFTMLSNSCLYDYEYTVQQIQEMQDFNS